MSELLDDIHGLADGELDPEAKARVLQTLSKDGRAHVEYQWVLLIKEMLSKRCAPSSDSECWRRSMAQLDEIDRTRRTERFVGRYAWGFCGVLFAIIVAGGLLNRASGGKDLSSAHVASLFNLTPQPIAASQPSQARVLLHDALGQAPVADREEQFALISVATGEIDGMRAARLILRDSQGPFSLFIVKDAGNIDGMEGRQEGFYSHGVINHYRCVSWHDDGYALLLLSDRPDSELEALAAHFRISPR